MSPKISFWLLLRLAVLLAALLVQSSEGATYQDFRNRHIDHPKTRAANNNAYCNLMMRRRGMMNRTCKPTNTFINNSPNHIQHVCRGGGRRVNRNIFESRRRFSVITCRSRGRFPNCQYVGRRQSKRIRVGCVRSLPVHFDRLV
ncbi:PREDICTED: ribonuclease-like [Gekko japonicus]|uniref:Ribonuclease-like n=1 Tax=Gekko japonicus TaxID=146911 RepID=A0ABM1KIK0_GEKJA|nr:PREDICTED: ribonuclease-like [Gekko japonicus]